MKNASRIIVLVACIGLVAVLPAAAQSKWDTQFPAFAGLAEGGFLYTIAPPTFVSPLTKKRGNMDRWSTGPSGGPCGHGDVRRFFCVSSASRCR